MSAANCGTSSRLEPAVRRVSAPRGCVDRLMSRKHRPGLCAWFSIAMALLALGRGRGSRSCGDRRLLPWGCARPSPYSIPASPQGGLSPGMRAASSQCPYTRTADGGHDRQHACQAGFPHALGWSSYKRFGAAFAASAAAQPANDAGQACCAAVAVSGAYDPFGTTWLQPGRTGST